MVQSDWGLLHLVTKLSKHRKLRCETPLYEFGAFVPLTNQRAVFCKDLNADVDISMTFDSHAHSMTAYCSAVLVDMVIARTAGLGTIMHNRFILGPKVYLPLLFAHWKRFANLKHGEDDSS